MSESVRYEDLSREDLIRMLRADDEEERGWLQEQAAAPTESRSEPPVVDAGPSLQSEMAACRSEEELTALLRARAEAGTLPGAELEPRVTGSGEPPTRAEILACRNADELDALLQSRVGDATASELGVKRAWEL